MLFHVQGPMAKFLGTLVQFELRTHSGTGSIRTAEFSETECALIEVTNRQVEESLRVSLQHEAFVFTEKTGTLSEAIQSGGSALACPYH